MPLFFVVLLTVFLISLANTWQGFSLSERILTWFLLICADIILVMEIAGLLGFLNRPIALVLIQMVISALSLATNKIFKIGYPEVSFTGLRGAVKNFFARVWHNKLFLVFFLALLAIYLFQAVLALKFPQNLSDVLYNHLSRIGFWLQAGSLRHYSGFNPVGMFYPYNNSLLAALSIVFFKSDQLVGLVQYFASIMLAVAIYLLAVQFGYRKKSAATAGLMALAYPIILFESITVQNDLLAACFVLIAYLFLITSFANGHRLYLTLSVLSFALAIGTNQYTAFALPGYLGLLVYYVITKKRQNVLIPLIVTAIGCGILVGGYSYIQNIQNYQNPMGPGDFIRKVTQITSPGDLWLRVRTNSSRLFAQFISCDGLIPSVERRCLDARATVLTPVLPKNIETGEYLYDVERFSLNYSYRLNAESAWFGPVSWVLIFPSVIIALVQSIRKKKFDQLILIFSAMVFFLGIAIIKHGWDPYQGRYLITAVVLLQPFTAAMLGNGKIPGRVFTGAICIAGVLIAGYASLSNESLPTLAQSSVKQVHAWGVKNSLLVQKLAYKTLPLAKYEKDVWKMTNIEVKTLAEHDYYFPAVSLVESNVPGDASLGIAVSRDMFFDYLFRGRQVSRRISPLITNNEVLQSTDDFILVAPGIHYGFTDDYREIDQAKGWTLWERYR